MGLELDAGDAIAGLALVLSVYSAWATHRFNKRQTHFERTSERLNLLLIEKESEERALGLQADLSSAFYRFGKETRLKIFNRGRGAARNIQIEFPDGGELFIPSEVARKFPVPLLEQHGVVELIASTNMHSPSRAHIRLTWDDEAGKGRAKDLHPTL